MGGFIIETKAKRLLNKGIEKGRLEERKNSIISSIKSLMKTVSFTLEQAISALKLNDDERQFALDSFAKGATV